MQRDRGPAQASDRQQSDQQDQRHEAKMYLRFGAMILTAIVVMYGVMYINTYELAHVQWSESRMFMAFTMGGTMALVMLGWMSNMLHNRRLNLAIVVAAVLIMAGVIYLDRTQTTVQDDSFMSAMIPHHSIAILRAERAEIEDVRVCELAVAISEAQRREIFEMEWLISDINRNGLARTPAEAQARPVPEFEERAIRRCPGG